MSSAYSMFRPRELLPGDPGGRLPETILTWVMIARQARMAHTEDGSYVVPIWMPLAPPPDDEQSLFTDEDEQRLPVETSERRVTRTLTQSLDAVQKVIVQPANAPRNSGDLMPVIAAGGSKSSWLRCTRS